MLNMIKNSENNLIIFKKFSNFLNKNKKKTKKNVIINIIMPIRNFIIRTIV